MPDFGELQFQLVSGGDKGLAADEFRGRQRFAVYLAVGGEGKLVHEDDRSRHHIAGQLVPQECQQGFRVGNLPGLGNNVCHEALVSGCVLTGNYDYGLHMGMGCQHGFDFTQLNAEAANFHLVVDPSQKL